jgi:hypothetical protein
MENYVVRIYRRSNDNPENITGVVENPDKGENKTFNNREEFYKIFRLSARHKAKPKLKKTLEFRKYRRFLIKEGTVVFDNNTDVGEIIDISMGGLAFSCPNISIDHKKTYNIGILFGNRKFYTNKIKCRVVKNGNGLINLSTNNPYDNTRISVEFIDLTNKQTSQLRNIIQNHTLGEA